MSWEKLLLADMGRYVSRKVGKPVTAKWYTYQDNETGGGWCETCGPEEAQVTIAYEAVADDVEYYWYYGSLGKFLDELREQ